MPKGRWNLVILGTIVALGGCASERSKPIARPSAPAARPLPQREPEYAVAAINRDIGPGETVWHMRAALNVASLSCTGRAQASIIANYNTMLKRHREALAQAHAAEQAAYRTRFGKNWQRHNDTHLTRLYNFFAMPMAQKRFCEVALDVSENARTMASERLEAFAPGALARLERPFVNTASASR